MRHSRARPGALDGARLCHRFVPFEAIRTIRFDDQRVTIVDNEGKTLAAKVRMPAELGEALEKATEARLEANEVGDVVFERHVGEDVHTWLERIRNTLKETDFRNASVPKVRAVEASRNPKSPLQVRVAALAALMDEAPEHAEALAEQTANPCLERLAKVSGDLAAWWKVFGGTHSIRWGPEIGHFCGLTYSSPAARSSKRIRSMRRPRMLSTVAL